MKLIVVCTSLLVSVFLIACASRSVDAQAQGEPVFSVEVKNSGDEVTIQFEEQTTIIEIRSPFGIGSAAFELQSGKMPEEIVVQLHVTGLEEFRLVSGQATVAASVAGGNAQSQRLISGNLEQALRSSDALWLDIRIVSESANLPLEDGYFEIHFPEEFITQSGDAFEIHWIDFFR